MIKTYYIYNIATDEFVGEVEAYDTLGAERKAIKTLKFDFNADYIAAFTEKF